MVLGASRRAAGKSLCCVDVCGGEKGGDAGLRTFGTCVFLAFLFYEQPVASNSQGIR